MSTPPPAYREALCGAQEHSAEGRGPRPQCCSRSFSKSPGLRVTVTTSLMARGQCLPWHCPRINRAVGPASGSVTLHLIAYSTTSENSCKRELSICIINFAKRGVTATRTPLVTPQGPRSLTTARNGRSGRTGVVAPTVRKQTQPCLRGCGAKTGAGAPGQALGSRGPSGSPASGPFPWETASSGKRGAARGGVCCERTRVSQGLGDRILGVREEHADSRCPDRSRPAPCGSRLRGGGGAAVAGAVPSSCQQRYL